MILLYKAIVKKISHEHDFKLEHQASRFQYEGDKLPIETVKVYMCKCGKVKEVRDK